MRNYTFIGTFRNAEGHEYTLTVYCMTTFQAFFLLTADAIREGKHYQLKHITNEKGEIFWVDDVMKVSELISA